jgi:hypothetical protein
VLDSLDSVLRDAGKRFLLILPPTASMLRLSSARFGSMSLREPMPEKKNPTIWLISGKFEGDR